jgi:hypothetical protein
MLLCHVTPFVTLAFGLNVALFFSRASHLRNFLAIFTRFFSSIACKPCHSEHDGCPNYVHFILHHFLSAGGPCSFRLQQMRHELSKVEISSIPTKLQKAVGACACLSGCVGSAVCLPVYLLLLLCSTHLSACPLLRVARSIVSPSSPLPVCPAPRHRETGRRDKGKRRERNARAHTGAGRNEPVRVLPVCRVLNSACLCLSAHQPLPLSP